MCGCLIGDDVDLDAAAQELGEDLGRVADDADRQCSLLPARCGDQRDRLVETRRDPVEVALAVTLNGGAPPIPPQPPVTVSVPASVPPNRLAATAASVS